MLTLAIALTTRCLLVALFLPFSALDKVLNFDQAVKQAREVIPSRTLAALLIVAGLGIEVIMSAAILIGLSDRLAALVLALYCAVTALLWKQFWREPDFRLKGTSTGRALFWDFLKNLALAGAFLALAFGPNGTGLPTFLAHPLSSSHPYISR